MIKRIDDNGNNQSQVVKGSVQQVNEKGIKVNDKWFNFSKFLQEKPSISVNDTVEFITSKDFITKFISIEHKPEEAENEKHEENPDLILLEALRSAVKIASLLESEVSIKFSTQDIVKLALTLFINNSSKIF